MQRFLPLLALLVAIPAQAQPTTSLDALVREALARSPTLQAARARQRAAAQTVEAAGWPDDPMLRVELDQLRGAPQGEEGPMVRVMIEQALPVPGALGLEERVAGSARVRTRWDLETARRDLELLVTRGFLMLRMVDGAIAVNESQQALLDDLVASALARMRSGGDTHHDVLQSQVEILSLRSARATLGAERAAAVAMLNALRDRPAATPIAPGAAPALPDTLPPAAALESFALRRRPELRSMRAMADEDRAMAALMRREAWPMLRVGVWATEDAQMPGSFGVMLSGNIPIFGLPRQSARAAAAEERAASSDAQRVAMRAMVRSTVLAARERYLATVQRQELVQEVALPRTEEALRSAQSSYRAGMMPFASVIQDRRMLAEMRMDLVRAEVDRAVAFAELLRELGANSLREVSP